MYDRGERAARRPRRALTATESMGHSATEPDSTLHAELADKREQAAGCPPICGCVACRLRDRFERAAAILDSRAAE